MDKEPLDELELLEELRSLENLLEDDVIICECFCVNVADIKETCLEKTVDLDLLNQEFGMGNGCRSCVNRKNTWINNIF